MVTLAQSLNFSLFQHFLTNFLLGLGGEKINWSKKAKEFRQALLSITGDIILSSGCIAYLGAFMMGYRDSCLKAW